MPALDGFLIGLAMIVFMGPVFFTLLHLSLAEGTSSGLAAALGVVISDVVCVLICYFVSENYLSDLVNGAWISILGGLILLMIGLKYIWKPKVYHLPLTLSNISLFTAFSKGFLVNFVNPFVFGVWIAVIAAMRQKYSEPTAHVWYLAAANAAIFCTDAGKVLLAKHITRWLTPTTMKVVYRVIGVAMVLFAIRLFKHAFLD